MEMTALEWTALGVLTTIVGLAGGALVKLIDRINKVKSDAEADVAKASAQAAAAKNLADSLNMSDAQNKMRVSAIEAALVAHRIDTAEKYVSKTTHEASEGRILEAIHQVGRRIDELFNNRPAAK